MELQTGSHQKEKERREKEREVREREREERERERGQGERERGEEERERAWTKQGDKAFEENKHAGKSNMEKTPEVRSSREFLSV